MTKFLIFLFSIIIYNSSIIAMEKKPYHHLPDGTFRNPEGSPVRTSQAKFSYTQFIKLKKKINMTVPKEHVVAKAKVLSDLEKYKNEDYIAWIGHATYLIKIGDTTIITDPVFSKRIQSFKLNRKRTCKKIHAGQYPRKDYKSFYVR